MKTAVARKFSPRRAFTLIEIMIVVAIIGLMAAMGIPSMLQMWQKEGMRKAVSDVKDVLDTARTQAILQGRTKAVVFHPHDKKLEVSDVAANESDTTEGSVAAQTQAGALTAAVLPDNVDIAMLDINLMDFSGADAARVRFFPNGTCDELTLVLHANDAWEKITLEFSTAIATASPVKR
jgi:type II secretion system protein H